MRPICAVAVLVMSYMSASQQSISLRVDHAGICGYDLQSLQGAFSGVGLKVEYGGAHATGGTHNALLGFDDGSYIELIALQKPGAATGDESRRWHGLNPGASRACFWAVHTHDLKGLVAEFRRSQVEISDPQPGSRKKPDGTVLQWQVAAVADDKGGDILPFMIQDITPHSSRIQPSASVKESELTGVKRVVVAVNDLAATIALYRRAYGLAAPQLSSSQDFGAKLAYFSGTPVILAAPSSTEGWLTSHVAQFGEGPVALLIGTKIIDQTGQRAPLVGATSWFGCKIAWFPPEKLQGVRLGVIVE